MSKFFNNLKYPILVPFSVILQKNFRRNLALSKCPYPEKSRKLIEQFMKKTIHIPMYGQEDRQTEGRINRSVPFQHSLRSKKSSTIQVFQVSRVYAASLS